MLAHSEDSNMAIAIPLDGRFSCRQNKAATTILITSHHIQLPQKKNKNKPSNWCVLCFIQWISFNNREKKIRKNDKSLRFFVLGFGLVYLFYFFFLCTHRTYCKVFKDKTYVFNVCVFVCLFLIALFLSLTIISYEEIRNWPK